MTSWWFFGCTYVVFGVLTVLALARASFFRDVPDTEMGAGFGGLILLILWPGVVLLASASWLGAQLRKMGQRSL